MKFVINPNKYAHPDLKNQDGSLKWIDTKDIVDYHVAEAQKDSTGNPIKDDAAGGYRTTGKTLEVSVPRGKGVWLEDYIADVLLDRYEFLKDDTPTQLKKAGDKEIKTETPEDVVKPAGKFVCAHCGQSFKGGPQLGLHIGSKHVESIASNK